MKMKMKMKTIISFEISFQFPSTKKVMKSNTFYARVSHLDKLSINIYPINYNIQSLMQFNAFLTLRYLNLDKIIIIFFF
jgi:hypothetical protein